MAWVLENTSKDTVIKLFEKENYQGVPGRGLHWIGLLGITDAVGE